ncbi:MAG: AAA family ATPase [Candidatus Nitrosotenuis sp.]|nr:AAA family ATPase [Candidatus Nitrosotenuis sp.]
MSHAILLDESVFDETFFPERLIGREGQVEQIARCLKPAAVGKSIKNLYIYGPPGVGKTLVTKWILKEHFEKISVHVNCWSKRTSHKVMEEILLQMGYPVHGKESTGDLIKRFEKGQKKVIMCLDESDHLKDYDFLYNLARSSNCRGLVFISNQAFTLSSIDHRIKSGLLLEEIEFKPYSRDEILAILKERVLYGLRTGSISENLVSMVAKMSNGDARVSLQTLKIAAKDAELKENDSITIDEIKAASKCARKYRLSYLLGKLNDHQRIIYSILKKSRTMESGKLFDEYEKILKQRAPPRSYRHYMQKMQEIGLVKEHGTGRWKRYEIIA